MVYFDISFLYFIRNNCIDIVIIDNDYNNEDGGEVTNKTYSVHYINTLIGGSITNKDR